MQTIAPRVGLSGEFDVASISSLQITANTPLLPPICVAAPESNNCLLATGIGMAGLREKIKVNSLFLPSPLTLFIIPANPS